MKNNFTKFMSALVMIMLVFALVMPCEAQAASKPKISKTKVTLTHAKGKCTYKLKVRNVPSGGKVTWSTKNKKIARVTKVKVTKTTSTYKVLSIAKGTTYVYAKVYNKKGKLVKTLKCKVKCSKKHSFKAKVTKKATYSSTGVRTYTCSCGVSYKVSIPKLTKKVTIDYGPNEEIDGKEGTNNGCSHSWDKYEYVDSYKEYNPMTGKYSTYKVYQCSVCGEKDYREVNTSDSYTITCSKNGKVHTWTEWVKYGTPTGGYYRCIICDCGKKCYSDAEYDVHQAVTGCGHCWTSTIYTLYYKYCTTCGARVFNDKYCDTH